MTRRVVSAGAVVLALGVGFAGGWLAHRPAPPPTPNRSSTTELVYVPNVLVETARQAIAQLRPMGLHWVLIPAPPNTLPVQPRVATQAPAPGTLVLTGTTVRLSMSTSPSG